MAKEKVMTVNDMREVVKANTSILQIVIKQQLDIVNGLNELKKQQDRIEALCQPVLMEMPDGDNGGAIPYRVDSHSSDAVGDQAVPEKSS